MLVSPDADAVAGRFRQRRLRLPGVWNAGRHDLHGHLQRDRRQCRRVNAVTVGVSGAQDAARAPPSRPTRRPTEFEIDTVNPTVTDVTASDLVITDVDAGTGTLSRSPVTFSEAMVDNARQPRR